VAGSLWLVGWGKVLCTHTDALSECESRLYFPQFGSVSKASRGLPITHSHCVKQPSNQLID
jgi:hypothetical protein